MMIKSMLCPNRRGFKSFCDMLEEILALSELFPRKFIYIFLVIVRMRFSKYYYLKLYILKCVKIISFRTGIWLVLVRSEQLTAWRANQEIFRLWGVYTILPDRCAPETTSISIVLQCIVSGKECTAYYKPSSHIEFLVWSGLTKWRRPVEDFYVGWTFHTTKVKAVMIIQLW